MQPYKPQKSLKAALRAAFFLTFSHNAIYNETKTTQSRKKKSPQAKTVGDFG
jgi:hypothetical protein